MNTQKTDKKQRIEKLVDEITGMIEFLVHMSEDEDDDESCCEKDLTKIKNILFSMTGFDE